jgi:hypothetical protein
LRPKCCFESCRHEAALATATVPALAQDADDEINPAPAAIGADVPATYFGPPPSSVEGRVLINAIRTTRIWPMVAGSPVTTNQHRRVNSRSDRSGEYFGR